MIDVVIVGGGPAGLALALGLRAAVPDIKIQVFERAPQLKVQGAGVRIETNGMKALQAMAPAVYQDVVDNGRYASKMMRCSFNSEEPMTEVDVTAMVRQSIEKYGVSAPFMGWSDLQSLLYRHLPEGVVQLGRAFRAYEPVPAGDGSSTDDAEPLLDVYFDGGDGVSEAPVRTRMLVGCDGLFSKVRRQWLNDEAPDDTGYTAWRGRIPMSACHDNLQQAAYWVMGDHKVFSFYPGNSGWFVWNAATSVDVIQAHGLQRLLAAGDYSGIQHGVQAMTASEKGALHKERAMTLFAGLPPELEAAVAATDPDCVLEHNLFHRPAHKYPTDGKLGEGPITLVGDAAHVIRPTGQGTAQAFEDAVELAAVIAQEGLCSAALRTYEAKRIPRWRLVAAGSQQQAMARYRTGSKQAADEDAASGEPVLDLDKVHEELCGIQFTPLSQLRTSAATVRVARGAARARTAVAASSRCHAALRGAARSGAAAATAASTRAARLL